MIAASVPVDPEADEARDWLIQELSQPEYEAARPTLFDRIAGAFADWLASLQFGAPGGPSPLGFAIIAVVIAVVIAVAFLIFGVPRLNRRSGATGTLFGADDTRAAEQLRTAAEAAARSGDYATAIAEMFRAIARGLAERSVVTTSPGTTAHGFAGNAAAAFPPFGAALANAASAFDDVRYLGRPGSAAAWEGVAELERGLRGARPLLDPVPA